MRTLTDYSIEEIYTYILNCPKQNIINPIYTSNLQHWLHDMKYFSKHSENMFLSQKTPISIKRYIIALWDYIEYKVSDLNKSQIQKISSVIMNSIEDNVTNILVPSGVYNLINITKHIEYLQECLDENLNAFSNHLIFENTVKGAV